VPTAYALLAEGYLDTGGPIEGLAAAEKGLELSRTTLDNSWEPELWRLRGELLLQMDGQRSRSAAERCFHRALTLARASKARSLELRAATSLARAWQRRGRMTDARRLLAGICGWFGTRRAGTDLEEARTLLRQLGSPSRRA